MNSKWFPDQKVLAGGLGGVTAWGVVLLLTQFGVTVPPGLEATIPLFVALAVKYLVPASDADIIKRVNDRIVAMASADPENPTTAVPPANVPAAQ